MTKTAILFTLVALTALAACGRGQERVAFDGVFFRASTAPVDKRVSRADFDVVVRDVSQSIEGAREAARYEGTRYCIRYFGSSRIDWTIGPDTEALSVTNGQIAFRGRCSP
ncbi:MAG: hypothetical protein AAGA05_01820 [Pseudomonadota bacterium]